MFHVKHLSFTQAKAGENLVENHLDINPSYQRIERTDSRPQLLRRNLCHCFPLRQDTQRRAQRHKAALHSLPMPGPRGDPRSGHAPRQKRPYPLDKLRYSGTRPARNGIRHITQQVRLGAQDNITLSGRHLGHLTDLDQKNPQIRRICTRARAGYADGFHNIRSLTQTRRIQERHRQPA
jgi:hypothetical protein